MGVMGVPGQGWGRGPSWEALRVKQVGAQREGLDRSLKLLWRGGHTSKPPPDPPSPPCSHQPSPTSPTSAAPGPWSPAAPGT